MKQLEPILFIVLIFAVFYFLLIRPQRKRQRETQQMQQNLQPGVEVVTTAGMHARVVAFEGDDVLLEVAPGVTCKYLKQAIMRTVPDAAAQAAAVPAVGVDATPEPVADTPEPSEVKTEVTADEPASDGADGATKAATGTDSAASAESAESADSKATDGTSPDGKVDGAEAAKAEESGTAKGDQRSAS